MLLSARKVRYPSEVRNSGMLLASFTMAAIFSFDRSLVVKRSRWRKPFQAFQTPPENPFFFICHLFRQIRIIDTTLLLVFRRNHDLTPEKRHQTGHEAKHQIITRYNLLLDIIREQDKKQVKAQVVRREYCTWHYQSMWKT